MKKYLVILCAAILIIIGLVFYWGQSVTDSSAHPNWHAVLGNAGSVVLISGLLTLLHDLIIKKFEEDRLCTLLRLSESITQSGLRTILTNCADYNYTELIEKSTDFSAIMNDGLRWVGNYTPALEKRFNRKHTVTELFLVNPKGDFLKPLADKTSTTTMELGKKLGQTISLIESTYEKSTKAGHLKIYFLSHYPTQTLFYTENLVLVTPYQTSSGRNTVPLYEYAYEEGVVSIASYLVKDLERVRMESTLISEDGKHTDT